ncbi:MAG TPA: sulfite exporter TauE/SafE family protein [Xanthobacteraceae bacterium]|nr:sulfite exporter TauE/SafE family protein [Xanthobacteraceae bacterium]
MPTVLLTPELLAIVWLGAFVGGIATGAAGFAFAVIAASFWLHVLDPLHTTALIISVGLFVQGWLIWRMRHHIEPARLWPFIPGCVIGVPLGVYLLTITDFSVLKAGIGVFMVLYGLYAVAAPRLPYVQAGRWADGLVGLVGGVMGGIGGYSGVVPTMWTQLRGWPKEVARGVYQPFILMAQIGTLSLIGGTALDTNALILAAATLPPVLAGVLVGWTIYGRLDERRFRQVLGALLVLSGAALIL